MIHLNRSSGFFYCSRLKSLLFLFSLSYKHLLSLHAPSAVRVNNSTPQRVNTHLYAPLCLSMSGPTGLTLLIALYTPTFTVLPWCSCSTFLRIICCQEFVIETLMYSEDVALSLSEVCLFLAACVLPYWGEKSPTLLCAGGATSYGCKLKPFSEVEDLIWVCMWPTVIVSESINCLMFYNLDICVKQLVYRVQWMTLSSIPDCLTPKKTQLDLQESIVCLKINYTILHF